MLEEKLVEKTSRVASETMHVRLNETPISVFDLHPDSRRWIVTVRSRHEEFVDTLQGGTRWVCLWPASYDPM